ncbi:hypothetical protein, partial [Methylomonas sp. MgM2]
LPESFSGLAISSNIDSTCCLSLLSCASVAATMSMLIHVDGYLAVAPLHETNYLNSFLFSSVF